MGEMNLDVFEPYLSMIGDESLRKGVREIWEELFRRSEWKEPGEAPFELKKNSVSMLQHTLNVAAYVAELAEVYGSAYKDKNMVFDQDVLIAGALLHRVSRFLEYRPGKNGPEMSEAGCLFGENFFAADLIRKKKLPFGVLHIVMSVSSMTKPAPATREALLVYFADRIDTDVNNLLQGRPLRAKDPNYIVKYGA